MKTFSAFFVWFSLTLSGGSCNAATLVIDSWTGGNTISAQNDTKGIQFLANEEFSVTHLGYYDHNGDGLLEDHNVGIYDMDENLLASVIVSSGISLPLIGDFRYAELATTITLSAGSSYVVAGTLGTEDMDNTIDSVTSVSTPSSFTYEATRLSAFPTLTFPDLIRPDSITVNMMGEVIPEPSTFTLLAGAFLGFTTFWRRRNSLA